MSTPIRHTRPPGTRAGAALALLRAATAAGLAADAAVHAQLAPDYQAAAPGGIGEGNLFLLEAGTAALAALYVLVRGSGPAYSAAAAGGNRPGSPAPLPVH